MTQTIILVGLLAFAAWGAWISRRLRLIEYFSNRGRGGTLHIFFTLTGSLVGGYMFFGLTAIAYEAGTVAAAIGLGYCVGLLLLARAVPRIKAAMQAHDCDTMDDFIGARFGPNVQRLISTINFLFFVAVVAAQFIAMVSYLRVVAPSAANWLPIVASVVVVAYTALAGYKGVVLTDIPQTLVLGAGALILLTVLATSASAPAVGEVASSHLVPTGYGFGFLVGVVALFPLTLLARSDLWQRIAHARDSRSASKGFLLTIPVLFVFYGIFTAIGILARAALGPGADPESSGVQAFVAALTSNPAVSLPGREILVAILSLGIYAALLSTADSNLNIGSIALTKILYAGRWREWSSLKHDRFHSEVLSGERDILRRARVVSVALGAAALLVAHVWPSIIAIMVACAAALMVFLPSVLGGLFMHHRRSAPALASIALGMLGFLAFALATSNYKVSFVPAGLVAVIVYVLTRAVTRGEGDIRDARS